MMNKSHLLYAALFASSFCTLPSLVFAASADALCSFPAVGDSDPVSATCSTTRTIDFGSGITLTSSSTASSSLASGELKGLSNGEYSGSNGNGAQTTSEMNDVITVLGSWTGDLIVPLTMSIDGSFLNQGANQATGQLFNVDSTDSSQVTINWDGLSPTLATDTTNSSGDYSVDINSIEPLNFNSLLTLYFTVTPANPTINFRARLDTANLGTGQLFTGTSSTDFGNTAALDLVLPSGFSFSSESGVFLSAVPVPASVWLFGSGLLGLIGISRRKKSA